METHPSPLPLPGGEYRERFGNGACDGTFFYTEFSELDVIPNLKKFTIYLYSAFHLSRPQ
ncbi:MULTISPECIES: hypothetical protein [Okeania]|uniref:hypothetical protein n=1 Tax=Okeania TaxID=1458928 RepID=UPI000F520887|nr:MULTISPECIES: hypothetical protein [Okeania]NES90577.1 hypothetical protein [Okeania sp. SIO2B9]NET75371.1 hypothetical protein [Okeania sp. SIO1F9]